MCGSLNMKVFSKEDQQFYGIKSEIYVDSMDVSNKELNDMKNNIFEIYQAGFIACINGESLAESYNNYWKEIENQINEG